MRLLLTSSGLSNKTIENALQQLAGHSFSELKVAFIPTASNIEYGDKSWLIDDLISCRKLGFREIDIVDVSALPKNVWEKRIESADIIFVGGGNLYHLMYWFDKSGFSDVLPKFLKTRIYVGASAGSMVVAPIINAPDEKVLAEETNGILNMNNRGLSLVDFTIEPHINNNNFPELTFEYANKFAKKVGIPVYAIDDQSAVKMSGDEVSVVSDGVWKRFN
ncbi:hypothetical protein MNBD_CPR01-337 [hydrothermal vent metagenome]|uniref:Dipeptidase E n=1 Tax=hydrothermal vent metagenome TaxID=652676 RepID=A0A3B0UWP4_9ZZZZ